MSAGYKNKGMPFGSATISDAENGVSRVTRRVLDAYSPFCRGDANREEKLSKLYWEMTLADIEYQERRSSVEQKIGRRQAMLDDLRRVMYTIRAEVGGFSRNTNNTYETLSVRLLERLTEENEQLKKRLKVAGFPDDWRKDLRTHGSTII
jgi:hypothetical protein